MPLEEVVFFTDRNLGKRFPRMLAKAGIRVEPHDDHFAQDTPDADWLAEIGRRGWFVLTHDRRIRYKPRPFIAKIYGPSRGEGKGRVELWLSADTARKNRTE